MESRPVPWQLYRIWQAMFICICPMLRPTPGNQLRPLATKTIEKMTAIGTACVSEPFFLIVMNFSLRSRNLEVKRSGSVLETRDRAVSPRVTASGGEDNKKNLGAVCFSASCGRSFSDGAFSQQESFSGPDFVHILR